MVTFCHKCGTQAKDDGSLFCNKCGTKFIQTPPKKKDDACPNCGTKILDKQSVFCNKCGFQLLTTSPVLIQQVDEQPVVNKPVIKKKSCPACGASIDNENKYYCDSCGGYLRGSGTINSPPIKKVVTPDNKSNRRNTEEKSPFVALLCSFFCPGLGQVYNGETAKGVGIFFGTLIGIFIFIIPGLLVWLYGLYDAYSTAQKMNVGKIPFKPTKTAHLILFIILVIFIVGLVAFVTFAMYLGQYYSTTNQSTETGRSIGLASISVVEATQTVASMKVLSVGESTTNGKKKIVVNNFTLRDYDFYDKDLKGHQYLIIDITTENLDDKEILSISSFDLVDGNGYTYELMYSTEVEKLYDGGQILPHEKRRGNLLFIVPPNTTGLKLKYNFGNGVITLYKLN